MEKIINQIKECPRFQSALKRDHVIATSIEYIGLKFARSRAHFPVLRSCVLQHFFIKRIVLHFKMRWKQFWA